MNILRALIMVTTVSAFVSVGQAQEKTLKDVFKDDFYIGAAMSRGPFKEESRTTLKMVAQQFNSTTPGNELKWQPFNPKPGEFNYAPADEFIEFGNENNMYVVGHVLFWHSQTPEWVYKGDKGKTLSRDALLDRMRERVRHVATRYKGKINAWDVVNESIMGDGRLRGSDWVKIVGDDFIEQAFRIADEELPKDVELIYNDYSMTGKGKRNAVVKMVKEFKEQGIRIDGVGMQGHWALDGPSIKEIEASIIAFSNAGVDVHITELDIDVLPRHPKMWSGNADVKLELQSDPKLDPYKDGLPDDIQKKLAKRYENIFALFLKHKDKIKRVTFWGPSDKHSWLNGWPIKGRTNYPLLFDRDAKPKPAFEAVVGLKKQSK